MVIAGLIMGGGQLRNGALSNNTILYLGKFWEMIDLGLNSILFVLIGMKLISLAFDISLLWLSIIALLIVLFSRLISISALGVIFNKQVRANRHEQLVMVWSGLKGGLSLAMALSITKFEIRESFVFITYIIVLFSVIIQGLTVERLANRRENI